MAKRAIHPRQAGVHSDAPNVFIEHAILKDLARKLLAWKHRAFAAHTDAIPFEGEKGIANVRLPRELTVSS